MTNMEENQIMFTVIISVIIYNENSFMEKYMKICCLHYRIEEYE